jgi:hypothetical protein
MMIEVAYFRKLQRLHRCGLPVDDAIAKEAPYAERALKILVETEEDIRNFLSEAS